MYVTEDTTRARIPRTLRRSTPRRSRPGRGASASPTRSATRRRTAPATWSSASCAGWSTPPARRCHRLARPQRPRARSPTASRRPRRAPTASTAPLIGIGERVGNAQLDQILVNFELLGWSRRNVEPLAGSAGWSPRRPACRSPTATRSSAATPSAPRPACTPRRSSRRRRRATTGSPTASTRASPRPGRHQEIVGRRQEIEVGPMSGQANVVCWLEAHGIERDATSSCRRSSRRAKESKSTLDGERGARALPGQRAGARLAGAAAARRADRRTHRRAARAENCWIVGVAPRCAIVDPGAESDRIFAARWRSARGLVPEQIVLTHGHVDHIAHCAQVAERYGIGLWIHRDDLPYLEGRSGRSSRRCSARALPGAGRLPRRGRNRTTVAGLTLPCCTRPGTRRAASACSTTRAARSLVGDTLFAGSVGRTDLPGGDWEDARALDPRQAVSLSPAIGGCCPGTARRRRSPRSAPQPVRRRTGGARRAGSSIRRSLTRESESRRRTPVGWPAWAIAALAVYLLAYVGARRLRQRFGRRAGAGGAPHPAARRSPSTLLAWRAARLPALDARSARPGAGSRSPSCCCRRHALDARLRRLRLAVRRPLLPPLVRLLPVAARRLGGAAERRRHRTRAAPLLARRRGRGDRRRHGAGAAVRARGSSRPPSLELLAALGFLVGDVGLLGGLASSSCAGGGADAVWLPWLGAAMVVEIGADTAYGFASCAGDSARDLLAPALRRRLGAARRRGRAVGASRHRAGAGARAASGGRRTRCRTSPSCSATRRSTLASGARPRSRLDRCSSSPPGCSRCSCWRARRPRRASSPTCARSAPCARARSASARWCRTRRTCSW
jgi:hydroxyacylglutathione hydrolase